MRSPAVIHEGFMNGSRMILPRVGGGVGVGGRGGFVGHPCLSSHYGRHLELLPQSAHDRPRTRPHMDAKNFGGGC